jgi:hypothetical protein
MKRDLLARISHFRFFFFFFFLKKKKRHNVTNVVIVGYTARDFDRVKKENTGRIKAFFAGLRIYTNVVSGMTLSIEASRGIKHGRIDVSTLLPLGAC